MSSPAVTITDLSKSYGDHLALRGVTFNVDYGRVVAYLGRNGSGKSTTVRILCGLTSPSGGAATVAGHDVTTESRAIHEAIGVTLQDTALDPDMTGHEHLELIARAWGHRRSAAANLAGEQLAEFGLADAAHRLIGAYSGGMRRRLDLAGALLHRPKILFLDEPTTGLDAQSRRLIWNQLRELRAGGAAVLVTTQYIEEAEQLADHVVIVDDGAIAAAGTVAQLKAHYEVGTLEEAFLAVTGDAITARQAEAA
jgi:ABC-2 type transport system ATP-binding protein